MDRDKFLSRPKELKTTEITLSDGATLRIRKLSQQEVETIREKYAGDEKALEGMRFIVTRCVVNDEGERVFADDDQAKLLEVDFDDIQLIASEAVEFSGLNRSAKKA